VAHCPTHRAMGQPAGPGSGGGTDNRHW